MALYTQDRLAETLKLLIREKPLDDITVQELVDRARVNRKTFYYHYHGISDLINWMYATRLSTRLDGMEIAPETWAGIFQNIMKRTRNEAEYLAAIYASSYAPGFRLAITHSFNNVTRRFVRSAIAIYEREHGVSLVLTPRQLGYINRYYSMAFYGMTEEWLLTGMRDTEEDFTHTMKQLTRDNMYRTFAEMHEENVRSSSVR